MRTFTYKQASGLAIKANVHPSGSRTGAPAVLYIHGGGLMYGTRDISGSPVLPALLGAGFTVVSVDYRLAPESKLTEIAEDVRDAAIWVRTNANLLGVDPARLAVFGESAGAYLALLSGVALDPRPSAIVSCWGYGDIAGKWRTQPAPDFRPETRISREQAFASVGLAPIAEVPKNHKRQLFYVYCRQQGLWTEQVTGIQPGRDAGQLDQFAVADRIAPHYPPTLLIHGTSDRDVPLDQSRLMARRLSSAGVTHDFLTIPGGDHGLSNLSAADRLRIYGQAAAFLRKHV